MCAVVSPCLLLSLGILFHPQVYYILYMQMYFCVCIPWRVPLVVSTATKVTSWPRFPRICLFNLIPGRVTMLPYLPPKHISAWLSQWLPSKKCYCVGYRFSPDILSHWLPHGSVIGLLAPETVTWFPLGHVIHVAVCWMCLPIKSSAKFLLANPSTFLLLKAPEAGNFLHTGSKFLQVQSS